MMRRIVQTNGRGGRHVAVCLAPGTAPTSPWLHVAPLPWTGLWAGKCLAFVRPSLAGLCFHVVRVIGGSPQVEHIVAPNQDLACAGGKKSSKSDEQRGGRPCEKRRTARVSVALDDTPTCTSAPLVRAPA